MSDTYSTAIFNSVKKALRWSHQSLDDEIKDTIKEAQDELVRVGLPEYAVTFPDPLIIRAVKTYAKACFADTQAERDGFMAAFRVQADNLRKSHRYTNTDEE